MESKLKKIFTLSLLIFIVGFVLTNSVQFNLCSTNDYDCRDIYNNLGDPMFYGFGALSLVFLALLFKPEAITAWSKFAKWFIPIATLIFIFYPDPGAGDFFSPYPEQIFQWISVLYVIVSVFIIARVSFKK